MENNAENAPLRRSLHDLARDNNVEEMVKLLSSRENVNARDKLKRTPLHIACYAGSLDAARLLIENNANVNALAKDDLRPLGFAVMKNHIDIVKLLLSNGGITGINAAFQKTCITCLHIAAKNGNTELVKLLLEYGSNPNLKSRAGETPADVASTEEIKAIINEHKKKWDEDKRKKASERRMRRRERKQKQESEEISTVVEKRDMPVKSEKQDSVENIPSKKLDLKKLAFALDEDDYIC